MEAEILRRYLAPVASAGYTVLTVSAIVSSEPQSIQPLAYSSTSENTPKAEAAEMPRRGNPVEFVEYVPNVTPAREIPPRPLRLAIVPKRLSIPSMGIYNLDIQLGKTEKLSDKKSQFIAPPEGIATANNVLGRGNNNTIWIYGHSRLNGIPQTFYGLQDLKPGEKIVIDGDDITRDRILEGLEFEVEDRVLGDMTSGEKLIFSGGTRYPRVVLQTSVRESGDKPWIFNRVKIENSTVSIIEDSVDNPSKYLLLFIVLKPTPETVNRFKSNQ